MQTTVLQSIRKPIPVKDYIMRPGIFSAQIIESLQGPLLSPASASHLVNVGCFNPPSGMFRGDDPPRPCRSASIGKQGKTRRS